MFGGSSPSPAAPTAPAAPPSPPMFGKDAYGAGPRKRTAQSGFGGTFLGGIGGDANTANKTLLGQ